MPGKSIPLLDERPYGVGSSLVLAMGSDAKAESWLEDYRKLCLLYELNWNEWLAEIDERIPGSTSSLAKRTYCLGRRLVFIYGSEAAAEKWLETENPRAPFHGGKPADTFANLGEGWYLDQTSNVYVRKHLDAYLAAQEHIST